MMEVLVHYTTKNEVFLCFNKLTYTINNKKFPTLFNKIDEYYKKNHKFQQCFLIINFYNITARNRILLAGKITNSGDNYIFSKIDDEQRKLIIDNIGKDLLNKYDKSIYYKIYYINNNNEFYIKNCGKGLKVRLKFYSWDELLSDDTILHKKLIDILFNRLNVFDLTTLRSSTIYSFVSEETQNNFYISALYSVGFISENLNISNTTLHGDIGEFLMNYFIRKCVMEDNPEYYVFPKLAFKTGSKCSVHGNDGTFYNERTKNIYYLEAKFYKELDKAINEAVNSMNSHIINGDYHFVNNHTDSLRNLATSETNQIIEITRDVKENYIIFLICEDIYLVDEIKKTINSNEKLSELSDIDELTIIVFPILNKDNFMKLFEGKSKEVKGI